MNSDASDGSSPEMRERERVSAAARESAVMKARRIRIVCFSVVGFALVGVLIVAATGASSGLAKAAIVLLFCLAGVCFRGAKAANRWEADQMRH